MEVVKSSELIKRLYRLISIQEKELLRISELRDRLAGIPSEQEAQADHLGYFPHSHFTIWEVIKYLDSNTTNGTYSFDKNFIDQLDKLLLKQLDERLELYSSYLGILQTLLDTSPYKSLGTLEAAREFIRQQVIELKKLVTRLNRDQITISLEAVSIPAPPALPTTFIKDNKIPAPDDEEPKRVNERLPLSMAEEVADLLDLMDKEMATVLTISIRTYHRLKLNGLLNPVASERLMMLKELATFGLEVFENQHSFNQWLRLPLRELGNITPLNALNTATGFNQVKTILERIEYGVYG
ncbi:DUF2384 domain-containing protein [Spirosoma sp. BT702]|uniref:DUF2384 domain-containing protein n=1 Tax=Spirosoma profusum TaxID=2771354 RepID=A0A926XUT7_9BACT|nr:antitoxin Xre/MbcA/ParS toxin-binding domain-containing protein [Spirosoma profusum]MBD2700165.1 DUF2384 domain-containing protein [Spirosoma profusum]